MGQRSRTASACEIRQRESRPQWETASSGCATFVSVVQTANFWQFHHSAEFGRLNSARNRCVLVEGQMSARASVIRKIGIQHSSETRLVDDDHVIQAFSPYRPDQPLRVGILPGRAWSTKHLFDAQPFGRLTEYLPIARCGGPLSIPAKYGRAKPKEDDRQATTAAAFSGSGAGGQEADGARQGSLLGVQLACGAYHAGS